MGTTNSIGSLTFTGISTYSSDFQSILDREKKILQLPVTALQNKQTANVTKKQALVGLNPAVANLASAVAALGSLATGQAITASSSDSNSVSVVNTGATTPGNYTLSNITLASAAGETSLNGYADATATPVWVAGQNKFDLVAGSTTYHLDLTGSDNLTGLENAINNSGAPVTASIINNGSKSYLSIAANNVGATTLTLNAIPQQASLISNNGTGTETSLAGYPDTGTTAVSNSGKVDLTVGGGATVHLDITGSNTLTGLMNAINLAGAGVTASITSSGGQNYLQVVADGGPTSITLNDLAAASPVSMISNTNQGTNADFMLNGAIHVNQATNVFSSVIPGVSFTLKNPPAGSVTISLAADVSQLTSALQTFTQNYNALVNQVDQQLGPSAQSLGGDAIIGTISDDLRQLSGYFGGSTSSIRSLSDLGITFNDQNTGLLTFDPSVVTSFSNSQLSDALKFFGSSNTGFAAFANNFTQISDPISGMIRIQEDGYDSENTQIGDQITALTLRNTQVATVMNAKLQAADALVAQLQSQQNTINAEIQSINYVTYGKVVSSTGQ